MDYAKSLKTHLENLGVHADAVAWLMDVWHLCQLLDDAADGDLIGRERAETVAWAVFVGMPANSFYRTNAENLMPVLAVQVKKWIAANEMEAWGPADARAYMWRAGFYDLVLLVCQLCGVADNPLAILCLYGESWDEYRAEIEGVTCQTP